MYNPPIPYPPENHDKIVKCKEVYCRNEFKMWNLEREPFWHWVRSKEFCSLDCEVWHEELNKCG